MPRGDGTGPTGKGPITGRGMGRCTARGAAGIGLGLGLGCRRGFGRWFGGNADTVFGGAGKSEKELLAEEVKYLQNRIDAIDKEAKEQ